jgi:hypothetical protein
MGRDRATMLYKQSAGMLAGSGRAISVQVRLSGKRYARVFRTPARDCQYGAGFWALMADRRLYSTRIEVDEHSLTRL